MTLPRDFAPELVGTRVVHGGATVVEEQPLRVATPPNQWAYAVSYPLRGDDPAATTLREFGGRIVVGLSVSRGCVGLGITNSAGDAFLVEKFVSGEWNQTSLLIPPRTAAGAVVLRNASEAGPSECVLTTLRVESLEGAFVYPVHVTARDFQREAIPPQGDSGTVFDTDAARRLNAARLDWLAEANLVTTGARVLDAGAGVGHFLPYYLERACTVVALDGRADNVARLRTRYPAVDAHVADVQRFDLESLGRFDVIHCFGLLYHLESPIAALRTFRRACRGILIVETMVCDSSKALCVMADETKAASQALDGLGCRPSPSFLALALNRVGFRYVYGANPPPRHEEFQFAWQDDLVTVRDNHPLRCVFVASDVPIDGAPLFPVID